MSQGTMNMERVGRTVRPRSEGNERTAERTAAKDKARQMRRSARRAEQMRRRDAIVAAGEVDA